MSIKVTHPILVGLVLDAYREGARDAVGAERRVADERVAESTKALLDENNKLKIELDRQEQRLACKEQMDSFPAVHREQLRIVQIIRDNYLGKLADDILFKLALGDLK